MEDAAVRRLLAYAECDKVAFHLRDGTSCFGWLQPEYEPDGELVDLSARHLWLLESVVPWEPASFPPSADGRGTRIEMSDIDLATLRFYKDGWHDFDGR